MIDAVAAGAAAPGRPPSMSRRFAPPPWAWAALLPTLALLCGLGYWQTQRGLAKQDLIDRQAAALAAAPSPLEALDLDREPDGVVRVTAQGQFLPRAALLLDNQSLDHRPGYHVWSPLQLADGRVVMVNRGWVPLAQGVAVAGQAPGTAPLQLLGQWKALPRPAMRLGEAQAGCSASPGVQILQYPTRAELDCWLSRPVASGLLLLDADQPQGFVRRWTVAEEMPPTRHYGYAAQWFAFAATLLVLFYRLSLVPR